MKKINFTTLFLTLINLFLLGGCKIAVLDPKGTIAEQQKNLIYTSVWLMLIVVIPVMVLTLVFAYRYRESNKNAKYEPDYCENHKLEVVWWAIPIVIISILGVITWKTSHTLDPYRPLERQVKPIEIQVVALDWKWLFIYPEQGVASVNQIQIPTGVPINFKITAQAPMNAFWIPQLAGQIYAMEGMQTLLHIEANKPGSYEGVSANFSGRGFNGMKFVVNAGSEAEYLSWIEAAKKSPERLTQERYNDLAQPSENEKVQTFSFVEDNLFMSIMMKYMMPGSCH